MSQIIKLGEVKFTHKLEDWSLLECNASRLVSIRHRVTS